MRYAAAVVELDEGADLPTVLGLARCRLRLPKAHLCSHRALTIDIQVTSLLP